MGYNHVTNGTPLIRHLLRLWLIIDLMIDLSNMILQSNLLDAITKVNRCSLYGLPAIYISTVDVHNHDILLTD